MSFPWKLFLSRLTGFYSLCTGTHLYSVKNSRVPLSKFLKLFLSVAFFTQLPYSANSSHLGSQNFSLPAQLRKNSGLRITSRQKALAMVDCTSIVPCSQDSQSVSAFCPMSENSCFLSFVHFHGKVIQDSVYPHGPMQNSASCFNRHS